MGSRRGLGGRCPSATFPPRHRFKGVSETMCGIAGFFGSGSVDIDAMLRALRHRGPDDSGGFVVPGGLIFASELKALLASGRVAPIIDPMVLQDYLAFGSIGGPRTMLAGVQALPPAHLMIVESGATRVSRYWSLGSDRISGVRSL